LNTPYARLYDIMESLQEVCDSPMEIEGFQDTYGEIIDYDTDSNPGAESNDDTHVNDNAHVDDDDDDEIA